MPRLVHVVNPVAFPPEHALSRAQAVTFEAMRVARALGPEADVAFHAVHYPEDAPAVPAFFDGRGELRRSVLDVKRFEKRRKLPFLADILQRAFEASDADHVVFTNIDISPMPYFYSAIAQRIADGHTCFTVNRRTIAATPDTPDRLPQMWAQAGKPHPGHDCFVFPRRWIPELDLGAIITGVPWIGFILLANLACQARDIEVHEDLHLTFHLGDDQAWTSAADQPYREHNAREALGILHRLEARWGRFPRGTYLGQHVTLAEQQVAAFDRARAAAPPAAPEAGISAVDRQRLILVPGPRQESPGNRFVFCINSGRCGSEYLAQLLGTGAGVVSHHEAEPTMSGRYLKMVTTRPLDTSLAERMIKAQAIRRGLDAAPPGAVWAETNHMFIKTFWDVALKAFAPEDIDVIILRRHLPSVLKSFVNLGYFSERNRVWPDWMHTPGAMGSALEPLAPDHMLDQYELAIGYLLDIEARAQRFVASHPGCRIHEVRLEELQTLPAAEALLTALRIAPTAATPAAVGRRVNDRGERKTAIGIETSLAYCEHRLQGYIDLCSRRGIALPTLPQAAA